MPNNESSSCALSSATSGTSCITWVGGEEGGEEGGREALACTAAGGIAAAAGALFAGAPFSTAAGIAAVAGWVGAGVAPSVACFFLDGFAVGLVSLVSCVDACKGCVCTGCAPTHSAFGGGASDLMPGAALDVP